MTFDIDTIETGGQSATAAACEHAALFGATPANNHHIAIYRLAD